MYDSPTTSTTPSADASARSPANAPRRRADWHARLLQAYEVAATLPFAYGTHDCCLWAAHCVDAMCGTRIAREISERFNYRDEAAALAVIEAGGGLAKLVEGFLGKPRRPAFAMPGDVVLVRDYADQVVVGVLLDHTVVVPSAAGLLGIPLERAILSWRV